MPNPIKQSKKLHDHEAPTEGKPPTAKKPKLNIDRCAFASSAITTSRRYAYENWASVHCTKTELVAGVIFYKSEKEPLEPAWTSDQEKDFATDPATKIGEYNLYGWYARRANGNDFTSNEIIQYSSKRTRFAWMQGLLILDNNQSPQEAAQLVCDGMNVSQQSCHIYLTLYCPTDHTAFK
jgi:hypothetical protein